VEKGVFEAIGEKVVEDPVFMKNMEKRLNDQLANRAKSLKKINKTLDDVSKKVEEGLQRTADDVARDLESLKLRPWADAEAKLKLNTERVQIQARLKEVLDEMDLRQNEYLNITGEDGLLIRASEAEVSAAKQEILALQEQLSTANFKLKNTKDMLAALNKSVEMIVKRDEKFVVQANLVAEQIENIVLGTVDKKTFVGHQQFLTDLKKGLDQNYLATDSVRLKGQQLRNPSTSLQWTERGANPAYKTLMGADAKGEFNIFERAQRSVAIAKRKSIKAGDAGTFPEASLLKKKFRELYLKSEKFAGRVDAEDTIKQYVDLVDDPGQEFIDTAIKADQTFLTSLEHVNLTVDAVKKFADEKFYDLTLKNIAEGRATDEELRAFGLALVISDSTKVNAELRAAIVENATNEKFRRFVTARRSAKGMVKDKFASEAYDTYQKTAEDFKDAVLNYIEYQRVTPYNIVTDFGDDIVRGANLDTAGETRLREVLDFISREDGSTGMIEGARIDGEMMLRSLPVNEEVLVKIFGRDSQFGQTGADFMDAFSTEMYTLDAYKALMEGASTSGNVSDAVTWGDIFDFASKKTRDYTEASFELSELSAGFAKAETRTTYGTISVKEFLDTRLDPKHFGDDIFEGSRRQGTAKTTKYSDYLDNEFNKYFQENEGDSLESLLSQAKKSRDETAIEFYDSEGAKDLKRGRALLQSGKISAEDYASIKAEVVLRQNQLTAEIKAGKDFSLKLQNKKEELGRLILETQFDKEVSIRMTELTETLSRVGLAPTAEMYDAIVVASARRMGKEYVDSMDVLRAAQNKFAEALDIPVQDYATDPQGLFAKIMDTLHGVGGDEGSMHQAVRDLMNDAKDSSSLFARMKESGMGISATGTTEIESGIVGRIRRATSTVKGSEAGRYVDPAELETAKRLLAQVEANPTMVQDLKKSFLKDAQAWYVTHVDRTIESKSVTKKMISDKLRELDVVAKAEKGQGIKRGSMTDTSSVADMYRWLKDRSNMVDARRKELRKSFSFFTDRMDPFWVARNLKDENIGSRLDNLYSISRKLESELETGRALDNTIIGLEEKLYDQLPEAARNKRLLARLESRNPRESIFVANTKSGEPMLNQVEYEKALAAFDEPASVAKMGFDEAKKWRATNTRAKNAFIAEAEAAEALAMKQRDRLLMDVRNATNILNDFKQSSEYLRAAQMQREHGLLKQLAGMDLRNPRNILSAQAPHHEVAKELFKGATPVYYRARPSSEALVLERDIADLAEKIKNIDNFKASNANQGAGRMASQDMKDVLDAVAVADERAQATLRAQFVEKIAVAEESLRKLNYKNEVFKTDRDHVFVSANEYFTQKPDVEKVDELMARLTEERMLDRRVSGKMTGEVSWLNAEQQLYSSDYVIREITLADRSNLGANGRLLDELTLKRQELSATLKQRKLLDRQQGFNRGSPSAQKALEKTYRRVPPQDKIIVDLRNIDIAIAKRQQLMDETTALGIGQGRLKNVQLNNLGESNIPANIKLLEARLKKSLDTVVSKKNDLRWAEGTMLPTYDPAGRVVEVLDMSGKSIEFSSAEIDAMLNGRYHLTTVSSRNEILAFTMEKLQSANNELSKFGSGLDTVFTGNRTHMDDLYRDFAESIARGEGDPTETLNAYIANAQKFADDSILKINRKYKEYLSYLKVNQAEINGTYAPWYMEEKINEAFLGRNQQIAMLKKKVNDVEMAARQAVDHYAKQRAKGLTLVQIRDAAKAERARWEEMSIHWRSGMEKVRAMANGQQDTLTKDFLKGELTPRNMALDPEKAGVTTRWLDKLWSQSEESGTIAKLDRLNDFKGKADYKHMVSESKSIIDEVDRIKDQIARIKGDANQGNVDAPFGFKIDQEVRRGLASADRKNIVRKSKEELDTLATRPIVPTDIRPGMAPGVGANTVFAHQFRVPKLEEELTKALDNITEGTNGLYNARVRYNELLIGDGTPEGALSVGDVYAIMDEEVKGLKIANTDLVVPKNVSEFFDKMTMQSRLNGVIGHFEKIAGEEELLSTNLTGLSKEMKAQFKELETASKASTADARARFKAVDDPYQKGLKKADAERLKYEKLLLENTKKYDAAALVWESDRQFQLRMITQYRVPLEERLSEVTDLLARLKATQASGGKATAKSRYLELEGIIQDAQDMLYVKGAYGEKYSFRGDLRMQPRVEGIIPEGFVTQQALDSSGGTTKKVADGFKKSVGEVNKREEMLAANLETLKMAYIEHTADMAKSFTVSASAYQALVGGKFFNEGDKLSGMSGQKIVEDLHKGWKRLTDNGMPNLQMRKDLEDVIFNLGKFAEPGFVQDVNKFLARYTRLLKSYVLANPGYVVRNSMTNTFSLLAAGTEVKNMFKGMKLWAEMEDALKAGKYQEWLDNLAVDVKANVETAIQAKDASGFGHSTEFMLGQPKGKRTQGVYDNSWLRLWQKANNKSEDSSRFIMAFDSAVKGHTMEGSAGRVKRFLFDYSAKGSFDKNTSHIMPFWFWTTRNFPMQIMNKWQNPRAYAIYNHIVKNMGGEVQADDPQWMREAGGFPIGGTSMYAMPDLGFNRLEADLRMIAEPRRLLGMVNPAIRAPLDLIKGGNTVYGSDFGTKPVESMDQLTGGLLAKATFQDRGNGMVSPAFNHFYKMLNPIASQVERLNPVTPKGQSNQLGGLLGYAGIPVTPVTPEMRALERQRQVYENQDLRNQGR